MVAALDRHLRPYLSGDLIGAQVAAR